MTENHLLYQSRESQNTASEGLENQGPQEPEIEIAGKGRSLAFEQINAVTWKLTDGRGSLAWSGDRSGSYRTSRALAWLMGVGGGRWVVRYRNRASKPMKLSKAKTYALEMVKGIRPGAVATAAIGRLVRLHLDALEPMPKMAEIRAIETADFPPLYVRTTPELTTFLPPEDCINEYYPDGDPILPDCLRRAHGWHLRG